MRKRRWFGLAVGLGAILALGLLHGAPKTPAQSEEPKAKGTEMPGKGKRAKEFLAAFHRGDARALAGFWTPQGDYIDLAGKHYTGREAIRKLYEKAFAARKGAKLSITVTAHRLATPDVAIEEGFTEVTPGEGGPPMTARFSAVLVRKDGEWYFESVRETEAHPPSNAEHFEDLEWVIGEWEGDVGKGESSRSSYSWAENHNFIVSTFATTVNDVPVVGGTQWIGWDAVAKRMRSWTFYSGGGFGEAVWSKDGDRWTLRVTAQMANGKKVSATNILTRVDDDHATWQVTTLTVDGKTVPDPKPVKLKRVKEAKP
jgi:uncharacterized protein (TIGR02246 family)